MPRAQTATGARPAVAVHGGAGRLALQSGERDMRRREALLRALNRARATLEEGGAALEAAQSAVSLMEDEADDLNAGRGSVLCADGTVQMSAALMRGSDRAAGAAGVVRRARSPIAAARLVLDTPQVLICGAAADDLAGAGGIELMDPAYFVTEAQRTRAAPGDGATVGAVCLDAHGCLAAATSTGGLRGQPPGRVGDTPLIGAGTWADGRVAVSCTGDGEAFIRAGAARLLAARVGAGAGLAEAAAEALQEVRANGGSGGLIAIDCSGEIVAPFVSEAMARGYWRAGEVSRVSI